jgi:hypothetical protein
MKEQIKIRLSAGRRALLIARGLFPFRQKS